MAAKRTALGRRLTEQRKARARLFLLSAVALLCMPLTSIHTVSVWVCYLAFVVLYSLWVLRLSTHFGQDRRLGYALCLTDVAILLPLLVWSTSVALQVVLLALCAAGFAVTYTGDRREREAAKPRITVRSAADRPPDGGIPEPGSGTPLERAVRLRLAVFRATGSRFALVVLRVLRFEETASYYGEDTSERILTAVSRRGLRLLGQDAQHFILPGGRVAFLFETDADRPANGALVTAEPIDVEGLAMSLGRKACERLIDRQRVECVVGWASAPADGLNADDLMYVAEAGAQSTDAFRRVTGQVTVPDRARVAAG